jgi:hypothetical protein
MSEKEGGLLVDLLNDGLQFLSAQLFGAVRGQLFLKNNLDNAGLKLLEFPHVVLGGFPLYHFWDNPRGLFILGNDASPLVQVAGVNETSSLAPGCLLRGVIGGVDVFLALSFVVKYRLIDGELGGTLMVRIFLWRLQKE